MSARGHHRAAIVIAGAQWPKNSQRWAYVGRDRSTVAPPRAFYFPVFCEAPAAPVAGTTAGCIMPDAAGRTGSVRSEGGGTCPFPGTIGEGGRGAAFIAGTVPIVTWPSRARCTARVVCEEPDSQRGSRWTSARTIRPTSGRPRLSRQLHAPTIACAHHARVGLRLQVSDTEVPAAQIIADYSRKKRPPSTGSPDSRPRLTTTARRCES
jgi:hypothetical protein